jgi:hypothetical protein
LGLDRFGYSNSSYSFDGNDDVVVIGSLNNISSFSISFWSKRTNSQNVCYPIGLGINNQNVVDVYKGFGIGIVPNAPSGCGLSPNQILANDGLYTCGNVVGSAISNLNVWENIILISDGLSASIYVDGNFSGFSSGIYIPGILNLTVGTRSDNFAFFTGLVDDIVVLNRALTPQEIQNLYNSSTETVDTGDGAAPLPQGIPYQAAARHAQGQALVNAAVNVRFTLHEGAADGAASFAETHALTTNSVGLFNTVFGSGTPEQSAFDSINWAATTKFLQVEIDLGEGYVDMGTTQLLSVPYALRSDEAARVKNAGLPIFNDNAAALAGGLLAGEMYRTSAGVLMIAY